MVSSVDSERPEAVEDRNLLDDEQPQDRSAPSGRRRTLGLPALTFVIGVMVTLAFTLVSLAQYHSNEQRLLRLRVRDAGAALTAALPTLQTNLASAAELADGTNGSMAKFHRFVAPMLAGRTPEFRSVSLWRLDDLSGGPVTVAGVPPRLGATPSRAAGFLLQTKQNGTLGVIGLLNPTAPRLGFAYAAGRYAVYAENALSPARRSPIQKRSAFAGLNDALYLGRTQNSANLISTNVARLPLPGPTQMVVVPLGDNYLTLVMSSRGPLGGSLPRNLPWIIAALGLILTAAATAMTMRLTHRRRAAEDLASRLETIAGENRRLYAEQRTIAQTLQHALLPDALPQGPHLAADGRYVAGEEGVDVGGDWYDVVEIDERRLLLVVGDVSGRGLRAARTMASLRYAIRAYAVEGDAPTTILSKVSRLVSVDETGQLATILTLLVDAAEGTVTVASAGHLPPLLIDGEGSRYLETEVGLPVGVEAGAEYPSRRFPLPEAGTVVAFTDGVVERRGESIDAGLERLRASAVANGDLKGLLERLLAAVPGGGGDDDMAIVGVRWTT
jgi:serine phosphatase RsbU (regulator of sigma subunit)